MEKLIELLNEFEWENNWWLAERRQIWWKSEIKLKICCDYIEQSEVILITYLISKEFWFIKWLVENDKIDRNLVDWAILHKTHRLLEDDYWVENMNKQYYEKTLMLLAISDTPIDDLISYLKWEITAIEDWPITYRKDSNWKLVADREPPIVLC